MLGIGNLLSAEEGAGVRALEFVRGNYVLDHSITLMDLGNQCIYLVQNWDDYLREIGRLLASEPVRSPGFKIPVVGAPASGCH